MPSYFTFKKKAFKGKAHDAEAVTKQEQNLGFLPFPPHSSMY